MTDHQAPSDKLRALDPRSVPVLHGRLFPEPGRIVFEPMRLIQILYNRALLVVRQHARQRGNVDELSDDVLIDIAHAARFRVRGALDELYTLLSGAQCPNLSQEICARLVNFVTPLSRRHPNQPTNYKAMLIRAGLLAALLPSNAVAARDAGDDNIQKAYQLLLKVAKRAGNQIRRAAVSLLYEGLRHEIWAPESARVLRLAFQKGVEAAKAVDPSQEADAPGIPARL